MNWETLRADEYCIAVKDGTHDTPKPVDFGYKLVTGKHVKNGQIDSSSAYYISEEDYNAINKRSMVERWDVIMSMIGTVGEAAVVKNDPDYAIKNVALFKCGGSEVRGKWLCYYLNSPEGKGRMLGEMKGSSQQFLSLKQLRELPIMFSEEKVPRIVEMISNYDDLIENNQKQIKLLEEAAQRLYKEWFVDLRFPGHENTKIVDGVPEGWRVASIADICDTVGGGTPSTKIQSYYEKGDILWVTPTDITRNFSLALLDTEKKITPEGLKNSSAKMLPAETILMTSRASVGFFGMCKYEVCTNQGFISCIPKRENLQMYLLFNLKSRVEEIRQKAGGSTYLEISKTVFRELKIILPKDEVLAEYQKDVHDIFDEIYCRTEMIKSLVDMRNRLLPKLMSGEVEV